MKRTSIVIDDAELYEALRGEAARRGVSIKALVHTALNDWLDSLEEARDIADADLAMQESKAVGPVGAREFFQQLLRDT